MYVDDNIVKRTVINNVNMFFLNKDFNKIASNERTSVISFYYCSIIVLYVILIIIASAIMKMSIFIASVYIIITVCDIS